MDQKKIGQFIAALRKNKNMTQRNIAEQLDVSEKTISKWECGNGLPEVTYMEPLCEILGITVNELLMGERINMAEFIHKLDCTRLELLRQLEFEQLKMRLYKFYGIEIEEMEISELGAGSLTYFVKADQEKYVVKYASDNAMNHPELETIVCTKLLEKGVPVSEFIKNKMGEVISMDEMGRRFHVQKFIEGKVYDYHAVPISYQIKSAQMLAKIHLALKDMKGLPEGIGRDFFEYRTPEGTLISYENSLKAAVKNGDIQNEHNIRKNMELLKHFPKYHFDISKFTCGNTHGDYQISQIIWNKGQIAGVIDWTCACIHPYIWEVVRSYIIMAPECKNGDINIEALLHYIREYSRISPLNRYDVENAGKVFYYFLAVCDFYGQYYQAHSRNRGIYLEQAEMSAKLLLWFERNITELNARLSELISQENDWSEIDPFIVDGQLKALPSIYKKKLIAIYYIATKLEKRKYAEKEINQEIDKWTTFHDPATIRREMYNKHLLERNKDGSCYSLGEIPQMEEFLQQYL